MKHLYDVPAPAKLNLFLHITGRRDDGYHLLQSAMVMVDWCDSLHFELRADGAISREDLRTPLPENDLTIRAARALQAASGTRWGAHIGIEKSIPAQAGMGGGSSDAASCLLALNRLWKLQLPLPRLLEIGLALGADVPFFLAGRNAWVEGIGERLTPLDVDPACFLVVKPPHGLPTQTIFSDPDLKRDSDVAIISGFAANPREFGRNDMQSIAIRHCPGVSQALDWLAAQGLDGRMTGSGSAVFAWAPANTALDPAVPLGAPAGFEARWCGGLEAHPLSGWAQEMD
ncbi:MAG: 4-(cytidine 5'-diphospho)-2-C-methyl-D-erythritol kinase [Rhodoferax sp.]|nr:4-(cytidine 5'-diphospho)-2-C-methyl-D-erythritol kinase [Rhodoferax sp.]